MKIGVFDSGYGGLTILGKIRNCLPQYDYLYMGDNARAPYGTRSFDVIYEYTWQAVDWLFQQNCRLVILACNTASAKALRSIQMNKINPESQRVLGVIRPTVEAIPQITLNGHVGIMATPGTVLSESYVVELQKASIKPLSITQQSCPMWVPLIEAGELDGQGVDYFVKKYIEELLTKDNQIDTLVLGCTHYPLLKDRIEGTLAGTNIKVVYQGDIVAQSLERYLSRHTEIEQVLSKSGSCRFVTTESAEKFDESASLFLKEQIKAEHIELLG